MDSVLKPIAKNLQAPNCVCAALLNGKLAMKKLTGVRDHYMLVWLVAVLLIDA